MELIANSGVDPVSLGMTVVTVVGVGLTGLSTKFALDTLKATQATALKDVKLSASVVSASVLLTNQALQVDLVEAYIAFMDGPNPPLRLFKREADKLDGHRGVIEVGQTVEFPLAPAHMTYIRGGQKLAVMAVNFRLFNRKRHFRMVSMA